MNFGAFVEVEEGVEGLIHISELSEQHVARPAEVVQIGDEVEVMILEIDGENQRLSLSLKAMAEIDPIDYITDADQVDDKPTTLSDLFGDKLKNFKL